MKHETENIQAWLSGELSPTEAARLESHLRDCPACARESENARQMWDLLGCLEDSAQVSRESLWPAVQQRTFGESGPGSWFFGTGRLVQSSLAAAALVAGLMLGVMVPGTGSDLVGGQAEALDVTEDQLETLWLSGTSWDSGLTEFESSWLTAGQDEEMDQESSTGGTG